MCKVNFAATVNEKMPHHRSPHGSGRLHSALLMALAMSLPLTCHPFVRHNYRYVLWQSMPMKSKSKPLKAEALRDEGTLNPTPEQVRDPKFQDNEFFDPHDIVQVKYEMLRRVSVENASVSAATEEYGVSRPTYYQTKASFDEAGIAGLVPQKRGPRGPHKLRGQVLAFVQQQLFAGEPVRARELAELVRKKFDLNIHPRTIERAAAGKKTAR